MTVRPVGRRVALVAWFVALWTMLWADVSAANLIGGAVLGAVIVAATRRTAVGDDGARAVVSPLGVVRFAGHVLWQLLTSNLSLAWEIVTPTDSIAVGTVDVPLRSASPIVTMAVSNVVTLTPGTVTLEVRSEPPTLTIGVLHLHDPDDVVASVRRTERLAILAFGTSASRAELATERER